MATPDTYSRYSRDGQFDIASMLRNRGIDHFVARKAEEGPKGINSAIANDAGIGTLLNVGAAGADALPLGFATLLQNLSRQGQTDPALFNRNLTDISRSGQNAQDALRGQLSGQGLSRSGVGAALQAAIGQGTQDRRAGAFANEAAQAEDRKRQDLQMLYDLIIGPSLQGYGINQGVAVQNRQLDNQQNASRTALYAGLLKAFTGINFGGDEDE